MADVFISYASADHEPSLALVEALEGAGLSVWWDRHLLAGQRFQDAIVKELNLAAAVVVVWGPRSVGSEWVYAEARRATDQHKLVQVRTPDVGIDDLPAPFDAFHCPFVTDVDAVLRSVRALASPEPRAAPATQPDGAALRPPAPSGTLPRGTVTLLCANVENSAQQVDELGDDWLRGLTLKRALCRQIWARWHGQELPRNGDSELVAFARAEDAVSAAVDVQLALLSAEWPGGAPVTMGVGVHTGSPELHGDGYAGLDVERALQVAAAAHPGQILLTEPTAALVEGALPHGCRMRNLGDHRLHGLPGRTGLRQLNDEDLPRAFPPIRSRGAAGNLPVNLVPIVGRERELTELGDLVRGGQRLLTLVGPGGTGKTRLALAAAQQLSEEFPDGVFFVPLSSAGTAAEMWSAMAGVLALPSDSQEPPEFFEHVNEQRLLLVLDNLEQLPDADTVVRELLSSARGVTVVATSRRPLHVPGEQEYAVSPLGLADGSSLAEAARSPAVQMFVQAASRVRHGFALTEQNATDIAALCVALDGLPLALELTAARTKMLSPAAILARVEQSLDVASSERGRDVRQVSLRNTIAWSFDLLGSDHQTVLERLGVFEGGGATFESLEAVVPAEVSSRVDLTAVVLDLVDTSLVRATDAADGEPRFGLLETIKRFLRDRLHDRGELEAVRDLHAGLYLAVAETWRSLLAGERSDEARIRLEAEHDNLRAALASMLEPEDGPPLTPEHEDVGLRLCFALAPFWKRQNYLADRLRWSELAVKRAVRRDTWLFADCVRVLSDTLYSLGQFDSGKYDLALEAALEAVDLYRRLEHPQLANELNLLALIQHERGKSAEARAALEEAITLTRQSGDLRGLQQALVSFASLESDEGNYTRALELETEALGVARERGDTGAEATFMQNSACSLRLLGRADEALDRMRGLGSLIEEHIEGRDVACLAEDYGAILAELGDHTAAVRLFGAADAAREELEAPRYPSQDAELAGAIAKTRAALPPADWDMEYAAGRSMTFDALTAHLVAVLDESSTSAPH